MFYLDKFSNHDKVNLIDLYNKKWAVVIAKVFAEFATLNLQFFIFLLTEL